MNVCVQGQVISPHFLMCTAKHLSVCATPKLALRLKTAQKQRKSFTVCLTAGVGNRDP